MHSYDCDVTLLTGLYSERCKLIAYLILLEYSVCTFFFSVCLVMLAFPITYILNVNQLQFGKQESFNILMCHFSK